MKHWRRSFATQSWTWLAAMLVAGTLLQLPSAWGQQTTGTISGTISDESGAVMPGVSVTVTNTGTGIGRTVTTDARGFRNQQNFIHAIYFHCGGLDLAPDSTK